MCEWAWWSFDSKRLTTAEEDDSCSGGSSVSNPITFSRRRSSRSVVYHVGLFELANSWMRTFSVASSEDMMNRWSAGGGDRYVWVISQRDAAMKDANYSLLPLSPRIAGATSLLFSYSKVGCSLVHLRHLPLDNHNKVGCSLMHIRHLLLDNRNKALLDRYFCADCNAKSLAFQMKDEAPKRIRKIRKNILTNFNIGKNSSEEVLRTFIFFLIPTYFVTQLVIQIACIIDWHRWGNLEKGYWNAWRFPLLFLDQVYHLSFVLFFPSIKQASPSTHPFCCSQGTSGI